MNDHEVSGVNGFFTQTSFTVEGPGMGNANFAPDAVCKFTATQGGNYRFSTCGAGYDSAIYIVSGNGTPLIYNEDSDSPSCFGSAGVIDSLALAAGDVVFVVIDGYVTQSGTVPFVVSRLP